MELVVAVYRITDFFPDAERYGLMSQMRRAAVSIPSNIAEGSKRTSKKDFCLFLNHAAGSGAELETQLEIAGRLVYISDPICLQLLGQLDEVMRMLYCLNSRLKSEVKSENC